MIRNLQVMAESGQRLSEASRALAPDVPWRAISGFRNIVVHDYLGLDVDVIWGLVSKELPPLKIALEAMRLSIDNAGG